MRGVYGSKTIYGKTFGFLGYGSVSASACGIEPRGAVEMTVSWGGSLPGCVPSSLLPGSSLPTREGNGSRMTRWVLRDVFRPSDVQYTMPGCGDTDAKLPEAFYSTSDPASLRQFLSETDVLVCSLPSTRHTAHLLDAEKLGGSPLTATQVGTGGDTKARFDETRRTLHQRRPGYPYQRQRNPESPGRA